MCLQPRDAFATATVAPPITAPIVTPFAGSASAVAAPPITAPIVTPFAGSASAVAATIALEPTTIIEPAAVSLTGNNASYRNMASFPVPLPVAVAITITNDTAACSVTTFYAPGTAPVGQCQLQARRGHARPLEV